MQISKIFLAAALGASLLSPLTAMADSQSIEKYGMLPIYARDIKEGSYPIEILSDSEIFSGADARITVEDDSITAYIDLEGQEHILPLEALNKTISSDDIEGATEVWGDFSLLFDASSLPEDALLIALSDYDLIESALAAYENQDSEETEDTPAALPADPVTIDMEDGEYAISVDLAGGSGKAYVSSPALLTVKDKQGTVRLEWSSSNYDYMIVGTEKYLPQNEEGNSVFVIPITAMDEPMTVIADTTAMGSPHEVTYALTLYSESIGDKSQMPQEAAKRVLIIAFVIIVGGGILNHRIKKKNRI